MNVKIVERRLLFKPIRMLMAFAVVTSQHECLISSLRNEPQTAGKIQWIQFVTPQVYEPNPFFHLLLEIGANDRSGKMLSRLCFSYSAKGKRQRNQSV